MRSLLRPSFLVAHVVVIGIAVAFVNLGMWQLRRWEEVRAENVLVGARMAEPPVALDEALAGDGAEWRRVTATGVYRPAQEVLLSPRGRNGQPGHEVLTPLDLGDGRVLLVDRGWVPFEEDTPPVAAAPPPADGVTVEGWLREGRTASRALPRDAERVLIVSDADTALLDGQVDGDVLPLWLVQSAPAPPDGALPRLVPAPTLDEGSHLSYAMQWFAFTAIGLVGYPLLLRRRLAGAPLRAT